MSAALVNIRCCIYLPVRHENENQGITVHVIVMHIFIDKDKLLTTCSEYQQTYLPNEAHPVNQVLVGAQDPKETAHLVLKKVAEYRQVLCYR